MAKSYFWTQEEDEIVKELYPTEGAYSALICERVGRDGASIWHRAKALGLKKVDSYVNPRFTGVGEVTGDYTGSIRRSASRRGLSFRLTSKDIYDKFVKQEKCCIYTGVSISFKDKTASVDRIDSSKGYTVDNIQIVDVRVNKMKMDRSHEEFIDLLKKIATWNNII